MVESGAEDNKITNIQAVVSSYIRNIGHFKSIMFIETVEKERGWRVGDHVHVVGTVAMIEFARANVENVIADD